jgi:hypothetical protein
VRALAVLVAAATPLVRVAGAASPRPQSNASGAPPGVAASALHGPLIIRNVAWDSVRVEVRVGTASDCEQNMLVGVRTLRRGRSWGIWSPMPICWRREHTPGPRFTGIWDKWDVKLIPVGVTMRVHP